MKREDALKLLNKVAKQPKQSSEDRLEYLEDKSRKIDAIQQRIQDEYRKHKHNPDIWSRMAAVKIYNTYFE